MPVQQYVEGSGSGLTYNQGYEIREAAAHAGVPWPDFLGLPSWDRAKIIAQYRLHNYIQAAMLKKSRQKAGRH